MEQPEQVPRHGVVVARPAAVQKTQDVFVEEVEPEEAVVLARPGVHREIEVRRVAERCQNVPRRRHQQHQSQAAERPQPLPGPRCEELSGEQQIQARRAEREDDGDQAFHEQPGADGGPGDVNPQSRPRLIFVQRARQAPRRERNGSRQQDIRDEHPREQKQPDAAAKREDRIEARRSAESPAAHGAHQPRRQ